MERFRISLEGDSLDDSHGESELFRLREEAKRNKATIEEKSKIITSLRQQLEDLEHDTQELENSEQLMRQKIDRLKKELNEKDETIEAITHAMKEVEAANENLTRRYDARLSQITKIHDDLTITKKELEEAKSRAEEYSNQNELLRVELEAAKRSRRERGVDQQDLIELRAQYDSCRKDNEILKNLNAQLQQKNDNILAEMKRMEHKERPDQTNEEMVNELYNLRAQLKSIEHRQSRRAVNEEIANLKQELEVTETSWRLERQHKERYARENMQLDRKVNELTKEITLVKQQLAEMLNQVRREELHREEQQREQHENKPELTSTMHFSPADEVGEIMDQSSSLAALHHCVNHRIKKSQFLPPLDPVAEQKLRLERANELARRNKQTKPLHQTSYPLELDTFDPTGLTETDIKRGYVHRPALNDSSNQRKSVRKAEAFIV